mmetsp:Transcript_31320/g.28503  ORF Transcript_31320/g.28503 Transcript_31320/m.28503 type:complete len:115 (-) Transcript_31320:185-529(-)
MAVLNSLMTSGQMELNFDRLEKSKAQQIFEEIGNGSEFEELPTYTEFLEILRKEFEPEEMKQEVPLLIDVLEFLRDNFLANDSIYFRYSKYLLIGDIRTAGIKEGYNYFASEDF